MEVSIMTHEIHTTIGLYHNGQYVVNGVLDDHLAGHIEYNKVFRFGRALFVGGKCVYFGYLSEVDCNEYIKKHKHIKMDKVTIPYK